MDNVSKVNQAQSSLRTKTMFNCEVVHAWVAIGRAVVYYARADQACGTGIKCRHCRFRNNVEQYIRQCAACYLSLEIYSMAD